MDIIKNLKSAISTVSGQLSTLKAELAETNREINGIDSKIHELQAMPLSLKDYASFARANIEKRANEHASALEWHLFRDSKPMSAIPQNKAPLSSVEKLSYLPSGLFGNDANTPSINSLCFFFGDQICEEFLRRAEAKFGKRWGNEDLPTVEERRKTIADLEMQRETLKQRLSELQAQIDEISGVLQC